MLAPWLRPEPALLLFQLELQPTLSLASLLGNSPQNTGNGIYSAWLSRALAASSSILRTPQRMLHHIVSHFKEKSEIPCLFGNISPCCTCIHSSPPYTFFKTLLLLFPGTSQPKSQMLSIAVPTGYFLVFIYLRQGFMSPG